MSAASEAHPGTGRAPPALAFVLDAVPVSAAEARRRVSRWLAAASWPQVAAEDIVLAVNEAVANAIDHAYPDDSPGLVQVRGAIEAHPMNGVAAARRVRASIADQGAWSPAWRTVDPRGFRGHGMAVMAACVDEVHLHRENSGTTVVLLSHPAPRLS